MNNLSIVIPAFNEADKICHDIEAASDFLIKSGLAGEIIVVDDGSLDDTFEAANKAKVHPRVIKHVIHFKENRGKGCAVRAGIEKTSGEYVMFADAGLCVPYQNVIRGLDLITSGECELAYGSRRLSESRLIRPRPWYRRVLSALFRGFVIAFMGIPSSFTDTQCGFKIYRGGIARALYAGSYTDGFIFDIEIILRALIKGYRIKEFPVDWASDPRTTVIPHAITFNVLSELVKVKNRLSKERKR